MAGPLIAGVVFFKADGQQYQLRGGFTISPSSVIREGIAGQDSVHGFIEKVKVPYMEGELSDNGGLSLVQLQALDNTTFTADLKNGKSYIARNGWVADDTVLTTEDGKIKIKIEAFSIEEDL
jgi:Phage tail tube protein